MDKVAITNLLSIFTGKDFSDVILRVQGKTFSAHKCILAQFEYFKALFNDRFTEVNQEIIDLMEINADDFEILLKSMYGINPNFDSIGFEGTINILHCAKYLLLDDFAKMSLAYIDRNIKSHSLLKVFEVAWHNALDELLNQCTDRIIEDPLSVIQHDDFLQMSVEALKKLISLDALYVPEIEIYRSVQNWLNANPDVPLKKDILNLIRWKRMSENDLALVSATDILEDQSDMEISGQKQRGLVVRNRNVVEGYKLQSNSTKKFPVRFAKFKEDFKKLVFVTVDIPECHIINNITYKLHIYDNTASYQTKLNFSDEIIPQNDLDPNKGNWVDFQTRDCSLDFAPTPVKQISIIGFQSTLERCFKVEQMVCSFESKFNTALGTDICYKRTDRM